MGAELQQLRKRLGSVNSTRKITRAQELIAASRIGRARAQAAAAEPYCQAMNTLTSALAGAAPTLAHPLLQARPNPTRAGILVMTSDRGMCGGYNAKVLKLVEQLEQHLRGTGIEPVLFVVGQKGLQYCNFRGLEVAGSWTGCSQQPSLSDAVKITQHIVPLFRAGARTAVKCEGGGTAGVDELHMISTNFRSMLMQTPVVRQLAPLEVAHQDADWRQDPAPDCIFEPDPARMVDVLLPAYLRTLIYSALLDAAVSELAARSTAMRVATDNADDIALRLSHQINHARQAQITEEINEIISGADALLHTVER